MPRARIPQLKTFSSCCLSTDRRTRRRRRRVCPDNLHHTFWQPVSLFSDRSVLRPLGTSCPQERLLAKAEAEKDGKATESKKPVCVKFGLDHVTYLVEQCKAQLVVIAHDVDPIELVVWLPALCRKMGVPYCIVKGKSRLGAVVHQKTATALALTAIKNEDKLEFSKLVEAMKANFNDRYDELRKAWGGGIMGIKSQAKTRAQQKLIEKEMRQRQ